MSIRYFALILVLCLFSRSGHAYCGGEESKGTVTNVGTEFILCFQQNEAFDFLDENYQDVYMSSLGDTATVTITCKAYPGWFKQFKLNAHDYATYRISDEKEVLINSDEIVDKHAVLVRSTSPIVCYGMSHKQFTTDAFLALPKNAAGTDFRIMSYTNSILGTEVTSERPSEFTVAAFEDDTHVTFIPAVQTSAGNAPNKPVKITLNAGECYQVQANPHNHFDDLTGSQVSSDKGVTVYGGHSRAEVPAKYERPAPNFGTSRNHLAEALPPTSTWGRSFICTNFLPRTQGDLIRVLALNDSTEVTVNNVHWVSLKANEYADTLITDPVSIDGTHPLLVGAYAHTATENNQSGDPFLAIVPPVDQTYNDFSFFVSGDSAYTTQRLVVVVEESAKDKINYDGNILPSITPFTDFPASLNGMKYSITNLSVSNNPPHHRIMTTNDPEHGMTILAYGFSNVDGYGYTAGALLKPLRSLAVLSEGEMSIVARKTPNTIYIKNILASTVYLDSVRVFLDPEVAGYEVRVKEDVAYDIGHIYSGEGSALHLICAPQASKPIHVRVVLYSHTASWDDLEPLVADVLVVPQQTADVAEIHERSIHLANYPNPVSTSSTIQYELPSSSEGKLSLYDGLGRLVSTIAEGKMSAGIHTARFDRGSLAAGYYFLEFTSPEGGTRERLPLLIEGTR